MNKSPQNFERLVLGCVDSYDSESIFIFRFFEIDDLHSFAPFCVEVGKPWQTHLVDLQNAAAFSAKAAEKPRAAEQLEMKNTRHS